MVVLNPFITIDSFSSSLEELVENIDKANYKTLKNEFPDHWEILNKKNIFSI